VALLVGAQLALVAIYLVARPMLMGHGPVAASPIGGDRLTHLLSALASWPGSVAWLALPLHSTASDGAAIVRSFGDWRPWVGALLPVATLVLAIVAALRGRPVAAFGLAWVWIAFLPTSNLIPQIHARAERYLFLSAFGYALVLVDVLRAIATRINPGAAVAAATAGALVVALGFAQRTWVRTPAWQSTETLFRTDLAGDPSYREGRFHLANALVVSGRFAEAEAELRALHAPLTEERTGYVNAIGVEQLTCATELGLGRPAQAVALLDRFEREQSPIARDPGVRSCAAQAMEAMGRTQDAAALYEKVVSSLGGAEPPAVVSLALARTYAKLGRREEAGQWLVRARANGPRDPSFDFQLMQVEKLLR
jgi:tetratricopeptide (TPR) repeat protein